MDRSRCDTKRHGYLFKDYCISCLRTNCNNLPTRNPVVDSQVSTVKDSTERATSQTWSGTGQAVVVCLLLLEDLLKAKVSTILSGNCPCPN